MNPESKISSGEWIDAFTTALGYWKQNADEQRKDGKTLDTRTDYEGQVYRRCKAACRAGRAATES